MHEMVPGHLYVTTEGYYLCSAWGECGPSIKRGTVLMFLQPAWEGKLNGSIFAKVLYEDRIWLINITKLKLVEYEV